MSVLRLAKSRHCGRGRYKRRSMLGNETNPTPTGRDTTVQINAKTPNHD